MASSGIVTSQSFTRRIGRNALAKLASELIGRLASLALVLFAARQLGEVGFGLYSYALAWGFVLAQLADLGLQLVITREIAAQSADSSQQSGASRGHKTIPVLQPPAFRLLPYMVQISLQLKGGLSIVVIVLMVGLTSGWVFPERVGLLCLGLTPLLNTFIEFTGHVFRGRQELLTEVRLLTAARLSAAVLGSLVLWFGGDLLHLGVVSLANAAMFAGISLYLLRRSGWLESYWGVMCCQTFRQHWPVTCKLLEQALPLGIAIFLSIAYTRLAILLLQTLLGEVAVAHFSAAVRLVEPAQIVPASLMAAVFPAFTLALGHAPRRAQRLGLLTALLLALLGIGIAAAFWLLAPALILFLYGDLYTGSVTVLRILAFSILPTFVNYSLTHYLIARGQQGLVGVFNGMILALHAVLCWWSIPRFGITGPAMSIVLVEIILFCASILALAMTKPQPRLSTAFNQAISYPSTSTQP
jgi:O-antigen/teichoic acid export membrane protein